MKIISIRLENCLLTCLKLVLWHVSEVDESRKRRFSWYVQGVVCIDGRVPKIRRNIYWKLYLILSFSQNKHIQVLMMLTCMLHIHIYETIPKVLIRSQWRIQDPVTSISTKNSVIYIWQDSE